MKVTRALQPFLPLCQRLLPDLRTLPGILNLSSLPNLPGLPGLPGLPSRLAGLSLTLLKATALDLAILAGHLLLYPSGMAQERRAAARPALPRVAGADDPAQLPTKGPLPVVLLHGFIDNRSVFVLLRRSLAQHGRQRVESLNYSPLTCDIRTAAELLGRHIEEICERTGSSQVDVVGHSLGGLIARYYVQRLGGDGRVRTLVTLGTPHSGTRVAPLANAHPIVRQMRPGSELIEELSRPAQGCRTQFVSFWSDLDHLMDPLESACVDHPDLLVQNVRVTGIGHLALPVHPAVATGIRQALDTARTGASAGARTGSRAGTRTGTQTDGLTVA
ncbi:esterase/lipase family protein [Streptomyces rishiriensis]|uniref:Thioesterase domain-containing protein n=1 Tax=Streptomyces rishiriensis TaxID=68264 RepID=A0ABU0NVD3_STRRH|nr:alpha/beta fold hydrolase [Streptomyces rishiriensis]MDQ0582974.1 thioesterase domain-containing protein [Streptomyces rishiriensis]